MTYNMNAPTDSVACSGEAYSKMKVLSKRLTMWIIHDMDVYNEQLIRYSSCLHTQRCDVKPSEKEERLSLSAFLGTEEIAVHIVHIRHLIVTYTLE